MNDRRILSEVLDSAKALITSDRARQHGDFLKNHTNIAALWGAYLDVEITAHDAAMMLALLKIARTKTGDHNEDNYVDLAGYAAIAGGIAHENKGRG